MVMAFLVIIFVIYSTDAHADKATWADVVLNAAKTEGVDPNLLMAISLIESRRDLAGGRVVAWPFAVRTPKGAFYFRDLKTAKVFIVGELARGVRPYQVDVGAFQINLRYGSPYVFRFLDLLDPRTNARVAAKMLRKAMASTSDLVLGVGRYHSYRTPVARAYGLRALSVRDLLANHNLFDSIK